ncbi:MAG TPA: hypothetical protein V6C76_15310 [Drouetiella sp.]
MKLRLKQIFLGAAIGCSIAVLCSVALFCVAVSDGQFRTTTSMYFYVYGNSTPEALNRSNNILNTIVEKCPDLSMNRDSQLGWEMLGCIFLRHYYQVIVGLFVSFVLTGIFLGQSAARRQPAFR